MQLDICLQNMRIEEERNAISVPTVNPLVFIGGQTIRSSDSYLRSKLQNVLSNCMRYP